MSKLGAHQDWGHCLGWGPLKSNNISTSDEICFDSQPEKDVLVMTCVLHSCVYQCSVHFQYFRALGLVGFY